MIISVIGNGLFFILIPVAFIVFNVAYNFQRKMSWGIFVLHSILYITNIFFLVDWNVLSLFFKYLIPIFLLLSVYKSYHKNKILPLTRKVNIYKQIIVSVLSIFGTGIIILNLILLINIFRGYTYDEEPVYLSFPFKTGLYYVIEGGNGEVLSMINYHYTSKPFVNLKINKPMKYATDIVKLNYVGRESTHFLSTNLNDYEMFNEILYSPCDGEIVKIIDSYDNNKAYSDNPPFSFGNMIVIRTGDVYILMAHLDKDSIKVKLFDKVKEGQPIAAIGNSGLSNRPHLHIQASKRNYLYGESVPMIFDGKYPKKNDIFLIK